MRCPSCNAPLPEPHPRYCPSCGRRTRGHDADRSPTPPSQTGPAGRRPATAADVLRRLRRDHSIPPGHASGPFVRAWRDALAATVVAWLALLCSGVLLLLAARLQFGDLGQLGPGSVLAAGVLLGLASLGAPLELGGVEISVIPLGALAAPAAAFVWAGAGRPRGYRGDRRPDETTMAAERLSPAAQGVMSGLFFGASSWVAALVFSLGDRFSVGAGKALVFGTLWGLLFGTAGALRSRHALSSSLRSAGHSLEQRSRTVYEGIAGALVMTGVAVVLSSAAVLVWIIVALSRDSLPPGFSVRTAIAGFVYLLAFAPNLALTLLALALGAPVEVGASVTVGSVRLGDVVGYSLLGSGRADVPSYAFLLLLVPLLSALAGGVSARGRARDKGAVLEVIGAAAVVFGLLVVVLVAAGEARVGAGLLGHRGIALVAGDPFVAGALACGWGACLGYAGWRLAELRDRRR